MIAGEASGDMHGAALAEQLQLLRRDVSIAGTGGARMEAAGVSLMQRTEGVVGFVEVLRHIPAHFALQARIRERFRSGSVGLVILIDYPGFNMRVAADAHAAKVPVLYYITPQVWAWRAGRKSAMARVITRAAVILPFEEKLLRDHGVDATFVGHPLLDRAKGMPDRAGARRRIGVRTSGELLALFPGSRPQEIIRHLDDFIAVARELQRRRPGLNVVVSVAPTVQLDPARVPFPMVTSASFDVLRAADVALCKSGTTTLEAAVAACPCAIVYRTSPVSFTIAKLLVRIPHIGLLNIVAGRRVAPEFVQSAFEPVRVADALMPLFDADSSERLAMLAGLDDVRSRLGSAGAAARVAKMAMEMLS